MSGSEQKEWIYLLSFKFNVAVERELLLLTLLLGGGLGVEH